MSERWHFWTMAIFMLVILGITFAAIVGTPQASNAPPPDEVPWDSIWVTETQTFTDRGGEERTKEIGGRWQFYITKERYEDLVWGPTKGGQVEQFKKDLDKLKAALVKDNK